MAPADVESIKVEEPEEHFLKLLPQHKWLLVYLPSLPLFDSLRSQACYAIRKVSGNNSEKKNNVVSYFS